jgi:hypothetical protein
MENYGPSYGYYVALFLTAIITECAIRAELPFLDKALNLVVKE